MMKNRALTFFFLILGVLCCLCDCSDQKTNKETERYILDSERQWAESVATGDTSAIERIIADDFIGVDLGKTFWRGRFVWTDTWLQRNGRWQIVAAEDLIAPEKAD